MPVMKIVGDGASLISKAHPVSVKVSLNDKVDIDSNSVETVWVDFPESVIPTLEARMLRDKPLHLYDFVKINDIVHIWMGDGFVAERYAKDFVFNVQKDE